MVEHGALDQVRVELLDGFLVDVSPQGPRHAALVQALMRTFAEYVHLLRVQMPLATGDLSEPEPDLALVEHHDPERHPSTALLVIEVAITSQAQDEYNAAAYAQARVPDYWLIDGEAGTVTVFSGPGAQGYAHRAVLRGTDALAAPVPIDELTVGGLFTRAGLRRT